MNAPPALPRLLAATGPTLAAHRRAFGEAPECGAGLIAAVEESGLRGRGGAGFPTARKMAAAHGRKPVVVGNGAEGEPLSRKDVELLTRAPHLVLDGLDAAADAIGAERVYLYLNPDAAAPVAAALAERWEAGLDPHEVEIVEAPDRFVAGEESAAIRRIEGGPALPRDRTVVAAVSGFRGRPTLVNNVETLAHVALIARYGPAWFRSAGEQDDPGTVLLTLSGALNRQGVVEVPSGHPLTGILLEDGRTDPRSLSAVLVGGYHGTWLPAAAFAQSRYCASGLKPAGAVPGAGIVHALATTECGLARTAEIIGYLAEQNARQCGPCLNGLPRLAGLVEELAAGRASEGLVDEIGRISLLVDGRGSCRHPDGTTRMLRSALTTFTADIERHRRGGCTAADAAALSS